MNVNELLVEVLRVGGPIALSIVVLFLLLRLVLKNVNGVKIKPKHAFILMLVSVLAVFVITIFLLYQEGNNSSKISKIEIQGIIQGNFGPLKGAYAYLVTGDTLRSNITGSNGEFGIRLDTIIGTSMTLHFVHPDHESDAKRIILAPSQIVRQTLVKVNKSTAIQPRKNTLTVIGEGCVNTRLIRTSEKQLQGKKTGAYTIEIGYSEEGILSTGSESDALYTYLGGEMELTINGSFCDFIEVKIPRSSTSIGKSRSVIEREVCQKVQELQKDDSIQNQIIDAILSCI